MHPFHFCDMLGMFKKPIENKNITGYVKKMIAQKNMFAWHKFNGLIRRLILLSPPVKRNSVMVNEYPKSGGSWLTLMLGDIMQLPFARNRLPYMKTGQIFHGHYMSRELLKGMKLVTLWRDGRDVLVSLYYHSLFYNDVGNKVGVDYMRKRVPFDNYVDISENLPAFIEFMASGNGKPGYEWADFVQEWHGCEYSLHVKYEELYDDCKSVLLSILDGLGMPTTESKIMNAMNRYSIKNVATKSVSGAPLSNNSKMSFIRKGGYGGWREYFTRDAARLFDETSGQSLIDLGYESDHSWVEAIS